MPLFHGRERYFSQSCSRDPPPALHFGKNIKNAKNIAIFGKTGHFFLEFSRVIRGAGVFSNNPPFGCRRSLLNVLSLSLILS